jgi:hypothetical protein
VSAVLYKFYVEHFSLQVTLEMCAETRVALLVVSVIIVLEVVFFSCPFRVFPIYIFIYYNNQKQHLKYYSEMAYFLLRRGIFFSDMAYIFFTPTWHNLFRRGIFITPTWHIYYSDVAYFYSMAYSLLRHGIFITPTWHMFYSDMAYFTPTWHIFTPS